MLASALRDYLIDEANGIGHIPITYKGQVVDCATVDLEDFEHLYQFRWHLAKGLNPRVRYGVRSFTVDKKRLQWSMQREIMGEPPGPKYVVDHINGDGMDNRRSNLQWLKANDNFGKDASIYGRLSPNWRPGLVSMTKGWR